MDDACATEFEDLEITVEHGVTRLHVVSADPSVLHGVLHRIDGSVSSCSTSTRIDAPT